RAVAVLEAGGLVCYPTDTYYGIGCDLFQKKAIERLALLKRRDPHKPFAFLCGDLGEVARYAIVDNEKFRLLRRILPGPYTVVLPATRVVPRTALTRQRTVGIRVPDAPVALALVHGLGRRPWSAIRAICASTCNGSSRRGSCSSPRSGACTSSPISPRSTHADCRAPRRPGISPPCAVSTALRLRREWRWRTPATASRRREDRDLCRASSGWRK